MMKQDYLSTFIGNGEVTLKLTEDCTVSDFKVPFNAGVYQRC